LVLIVAAEAAELKGILANCEDVKPAMLPLRFARTATLNGMRITVVAHGAGPRLAGIAARAMSADALVSTGSCGAVDPTLKPGDTFVATTVNGERCERPCSARPYRTGALLSVDRVVNVEEKQKLDAAAVEMEAAGVAEAARERGVPFYCIRAILEGASEGFTLDFNGLRDREGRFSRPRIVAAALARPWVGVPELIRMERRVRLASRALGELFAECRF
jgi:nucleoside phosphorylase